MKLKQIATVLSVAAFVLVTPFAALTTSRADAAGGLDIEAHAGKSVSNGAVTFSSSGGDAWPYYIDQTRIVTGFNQADALQTGDSITLQFPEGADLSSIDDQSIGTIVWNHDGSCENNPSSTASEITGAMGSYVDHDTNTVSVTLKSTSIASSCSGVTSWDVQMFVNPPYISIRYGMGVGEYLFSVTTSSGSGYSGEVSVIVGDVPIVEDPWLYGYVLSPEEESIEGAEIQVSCEGEWLTMGLNEDGEYGVSAADFEEALSILGCTDGDELSIRAVADGYQGSVTVLDASIDFGEGGRHSYVLDLLNEYGEQIFILEPESEAGTQIVLPEGDENKAILVEQQEGTEICGSFDDGTYTRKESQLETQDVDYDYSSYLVGFTMNDCEVGGTTTMRVLFTGDFDPATTTVRKYNEVTKQYTTLTDATKTVTTLNDLPALEVTYQITDGGSLDQDGTANGTIVDPLGLGFQATTQSGASANLASTGQSTTGYAVAAATLISGSLIVSVVRKKAFIKL